MFHRIRHKVASLEYVLQHAFVCLCKHCLFRIISRVHMGKCPTLRRGNVRGMSKCIRGNVRLGLPVYSDHAIAAYFAYFAKMRISHIFPHIMASSKFRIFIYAFRIFFMHKFALHIFTHMRSHFSAFRRILSNVNTRARVIYATYFRNAPHILHQNGPHILRKISATNRYPDRSPLAPLSDSSCFGLRFVAR